MDTKSSAGHHCKACGDFFVTRGARDYHKNAIHMSSANIFDVVYEKDPNKGWCCAHCESTFSTPKALEAHIFKRHNSSPVIEESSAKDSGEDVQMVSPTYSTKIYQKSVDSDLYAEGLIGQFHLVINKKHGFVYCRLCSKATTIKQALKHIRANCFFPRKINSTQASMLRLELQNISSSLQHEKIDLGSHDRLAVEPLHRIAIIFCRLLE